LDWTWFASEIRPSKTLLTHSLDWTWGIVNRHITNNNVPKQTFESAVARKQSIHKRHLYREESIVKQRL